MTEGVGAKPVAIIVFAFIFMSIGSASAAYSPPSFSPLMPLVPLPSKTCDDISFKVNIPDAFYPFDGISWITTPISSDFLSTYSIKFGMKLQYWVLDLGCPVGCWRDYNKVNFEHKLIVHHLDLSAEVCRTELPGLCETGITDESYAKDLMTKFGPINLGPLKVKGANWRVLVTARGETTYKFSDCFNSLPWDICTCGLYCDTPPYNIEKTWESGTALSACCYQNTDCGDGYWNGNWCYNNDVYSYSIQPTCRNQGSAESYCEDVITEKLKQDCGDDYCGSWGQQLLQEQRYLPFQNLP